MFEDLHPAFLEPHNDSTITFSWADRLTKDERRFMRSTLAKLENLLDVDFQRVAEGGEIRFDKREDTSTPDGRPAGGWCMPYYDHNLVVLPMRPIHKDWGRYVFLHETGHALGLGHVDNSVFDSQDTVMSYTYIGAPKYYTVNDLTRLEEIWDPITGIVNDIP